MNANAPAVPDVLDEFGTPTTIELLALLISQQMKLQPGVCQIYNQKRRLPPAEGFFIDVAILGDQAFAANRRYANDPQTTDLVEQQSINQQELVQVDIFSFDQSARVRKLGIIFALNSTSAQQLQEKWAFKMGRVPTSFVDASEVEGNARLNRYSITFALLRSYGSSQPAETFTQFQNPPKTILTNQ